MSTHHTIVSELENALSHGLAARRGEALRHITNLFVEGASDYSEDLVDLFDQVILRLAAEIEVEARVVLAERLAPIPNAPPKVIHALAFDDVVEVACPVLEQSERLDDTALVRSAETKSQRHLLAISRRRSLGEAVTDVLIQRGDREVAVSAAENRGARFSAAGYANLVRRSDGDDRLTVLVGTRPEIPRHHFLKLLSIASDRVRSRLEATNPQAADEIQRVVAQVANRIKARVICHSREYAQARALVEPLHANGRLGEPELESFAQAGRFEATVVALALLCEVPIEVVERAILQERSELLLILMKAIGLSWSTVKAVLSLRSRECDIPGHELEQNLASFERLKVATAQQVLKFQRARAKCAAS